MDNTTEQCDEIEALVSIYDTQWKIGPADNSHSIEVIPNVNLFITLNSDYPSHAAPHFELSAPLLTHQQKEKIAYEFDSIYQDNKGGPILFQWIEKLKEVANETESNVDKDMSSQSNSSGLAVSKVDIVKLNLPVIHGEPIIDRKSVFQGHVYPVKSPKDVRDFMDYLLQNKKIAQATHNISAYRLITEKGSVLQDCDDDGETHAGSRLLHLLDILNVMNVMVVVTRWYGGTQLGPDRFKHINNAARLVLVEGKFIS